MFYAISFSVHIKKIAFECHFGGNQEHEKLYGNCPYLWELKLKRVKAKKMRDAFLHKK